MPPHIWGQTGNFSLAPLSPLQWWVTGVGNTCLNKNKSGGNQKWVFRRELEVLIVWAFLYEFTRCFSF